MFPIIEAGGVKYDVVCPSDYMIQRMIQNDMLAPLNFDNLPNVKEIGPEYMEMSKDFDPENKYSVPYCWGDRGHPLQQAAPGGVRRAAPTKWADLWDERLSGEILMQNSVRDAFMVALKSKGYSLNSTNEAELAEAQRPADRPEAPGAGLRDRPGTRQNDQRRGRRGPVIYSGEMLYHQEQAADLGLDYDLEYVIPEEGTNLWLDSWVIPANAENKENAEKWIDFMCRPDIAKRNFEYITYPTPNKGAFDLLDPELQENKAVFPDISSLKGSETFQYLGDDVETIYNDMWKEVKAAK